MDIVINKRSLPLSPELETYLAKKLKRLERHLPTIRQAVIDVSREETKAAENQMVLQVTLNCNGAVLRSQERASDLMSASDAVAEALERQIDRLKGRRRAKVRRGPPAPSKAAEVAPIDSADADESPIRRVKRFAMKPLQPEDAVEEMELLGHSFFLFRNAQTNQLNLVYKRRSGGYGLIEPEG